MARRSKYPPEHCGNAPPGWSRKYAASYGLQWAAIEAVADKLGIGCAETLRIWVRQAEVDTGTRVG